MYETEDMLPRPPPKPSAPPLPNEDSVKPTVPEVSIIFGKQTNSNITPPVSTAQKTSYAAWKKQVLPHATYPTLSNEVKTCNVTTNFSVFPLRTTAKTVTTAAPAAALPQTQKIIVNTNCATERNYHHSIENATSLSNYNQNSEQRRSVDSLCQRRSIVPVEDILTICASTQTDFQGCANDNWKQDLNHVISVVKELQEEQRQMRRILESFILQQQQQQMVSNVFCCDMATQCDILRDASLENVPPSNPYQLDGGTVHQALPNVKIYSPAVRPAAQSTQYRANTPINTNIKQMPTVSTVTNNQYAAVLPKAYTEQSMVMNELALKYLPSEKLNELMQDVQITTPANGPSTPLRQIDNFTKAPTDISTASFRYMRKYRLLPQQNGGLIPPENDFNTPPTYNQQYHKDSPIVIDSDAESPHLDLEHIRRQPKFL